jgi:hypothetical protein
MKSMPSSTRRREERLHTETVSKALTFGPLTRFPSKAKIPKVSQPLVISHFILFFWRVFDVNSARDFYFICRREVF